MTGVFFNQDLFQVIHHHVVVKGSFDNINKFLAIKICPHGFSSSVDSSFHFLHQSFHCLGDDLFLRVAFLSTRCP